ncbi:MAG: phycobilisome rod-core linker polypeptide [Elainellaceae cyanobacterium]
MTIPLLEYAPSSQNQRVDGYEIPGDEQPRLYTTDNLRSDSEMDALITAAYRQVFHDQQMNAYSRQQTLESQLRSGQITVKEFIRGLVTSDAFRRLNYDVNNNYRFVEICAQRLLGRNIYSDREKFAWSIIPATEGVNSFIDALLNSDEYADAFGDNVVPYQRRRILPQRLEGELPFERMARYGKDYRNKLPRPVLYRTRPQPADGLFKQFEPFSWQVFVERANWPMAVGLLVSLSILSIAALAVASVSFSG